MFAKAFIQLKTATIRIVILTLSLSIGFTVLMVAAFSLSSDKIDANAKASTKIIQNEPGELYVWSRYSIAYDQSNTTDSIMTIIANGDSILDFPEYFDNENAISGFSNWIDISNCKDFAEEDEENSLLAKAMVSSYARYWHGYTILLRPLLIFGDLGFIRNFNFIAMMICFMVLVILMSKQFHIGITVIFTVAFAAVQAFLIPYSMAYFITFFLSAILSIIMLKRYDKIKENRWELYFFFIAGALVTFFDFLTTPLLTLLIPLIFYYLLDMQKKDNLPKNGIIIMFKSVLGWGMGYIFMWLSKWSLASLVFKQNVFSNALSSTSERFGLSPSFVSEYEYIDMGSLKIRITAIAENLKRLIYDENVWIAILVIVIILLAALTIWNIRSRKMKRDFFLNLLPLIAILFAPFIWFFLTSNHSLFHPATRRNMVAAFFALGIILLYLYKGEIPYARAITSKQTNQKQKPKINKVDKKKKKKK